MRKVLWDAADAASLIVEAVSVRTSADDFVNDRVTRAAAERQFEIIGMALGKAVKLEPSLADRIKDFQRIIGLRNRLAHEYDLIDPRILWGIIQVDLPLLRRELESLLSDPT